MNSCHSIHLPRPFPIFLSCFLISLFALSQLTNKSISNTADLRTVVLRTHCNLIIYAVWANSCVCCESDSTVDYTHTYAFPLLRQALSSPSCFSIGPLDSHSLLPNSISKNNQSGQSIIIENLKGRRFMTKQRNQAKGSWRFTHWCVCVHDRHNRFEEKRYATFTVDLGNLLRGSPAPRSFVSLCRHCLGAKRIGSVGDAFFKWF